ncbi:hypothetical protein [Haloarcula pellucida]|uniref:Uncharacterized protein n=1 Tax=Haloarcula pellucida TaxID=1427151 RepID=A0A830GMJ0_9EURY|nr:hypothetical protein [Halomicroarcula pellucida]MBX0348185.1 hypothetical protein [Halomicroarcula pellucida]GGN97367.1 hypothetical protein GCM10009030_26560 [Halomicroarcula pellucida]
MQREHTRADTLPAQVTLHVGAELELLDRARHTPRPTELVVAPVELHQRNVQRRLREAREPKDAFEFDDVVGVSRSVLRASDASTTAIDRIDRLTLVREILGESASAPSVSLPVGTGSHDPQHVEQIRTEVETITNYHPERIAAWEDAAGDLYAPIDADTAALLDTALDVERALRAQTAKAVSETELVRRATRELTATDGTAWTGAYPETERLSLMGLSSISATVADFLHALVAATTLDVHVYFREVTGEYLEQRFPSLFDIAEPGVEVFE